MYKRFYLITVVLIVCFFQSCEKAKIISLSDISSIDKEEYEQIIKEKSCKDILNDLYIATSGNTDMIARMVDCTLNEINNIRTKNAKIPKELDKRINDLYLFYINHGSSITELRDEFDPEYKFKDKALDFIMDNSVVLESTSKIITTDKKKD